MNGEHNKTFIVVGPIVHSEQLTPLTIIEKGVIVVVEGKVADVQENLNKLTESQNKYNIPDDHVFVLKEKEFVMPGFVDAHIHASQYPNAGLGYDKQLLDWLASYTFPLEKQYSDPDFALTVYNTVVKKTIANGTTTAVYFATIHAKSSLILADVVARLGQRAFIGKVNMNMNSPEGYIEETEESLKDTVKFIQEVRDLKNDLVLPIISPRFALSCDMELMKKLGNIAKTYDVHIQTHISEQRDEVNAVEKIFPECKNYTHVYDQANLLTEKTLLAHAVYLSDEELKVLASRGTGIAHCPNSNTSLKSGLCDVRKMLQAGIKVGLGTDVSGGYSASILDAIHSALAVSIHLSFIKGKEYVPLTYHEAFYLATLGGAQVLGLDKKIGNFKPGKDFDAIIVNLSNPGPVDVLQECDTEMLVQMFLYNGDDRNINKVYIAGKQVK